MATQTKAEIIFTCPECKSSSMSKTWNKGDIPMPNRHPFTTSTHALHAGIGIRKCSGCGFKLVIVYDGTLWTSQRFCSAYSNKYDHGIYKEGLELLSQKK